MISYYELLTMIQEGNIPEKIIVYLTPGTKMPYVAMYDDKEFRFYYLENKEDNKNKGYSLYLSECFLESNMFDKNIELTNDYITDNIIEKLDFESLLQLKKCRREKKVIKKINEIIDKINEVKEYEEE